MPYIQLISATGKVQPNRTHCVQSIMIDFTDRRAEHNGPFAGARQHTSQRFFGAIVRTREMMAHCSITKN